MQYYASSEQRGCRSIRGEFVKRVLVHIQSAIDEGEVVSGVGDQQMNTVRIPTAPGFNSRMTLERTQMKLLYLPRTFMKRAIQC
jgi:hypothetical protein